MTADLQFTNEVLIRRSPVDVFAFLADFTNLPLWNYAIRATEKLSPGPVAVGSRYRQQRSVPAPAEETFTVTEWDPDRRVAISGDFGAFTGTLTYRLDPAPTGTTLANDVLLRPHRRLGLLGRVAGAQVRSAMAENLDELRRGLERVG
jgi:uncharacterized protein YndB with AHSA1/START domain